MLNEVICGTKTNGKKPPILYMHLFLSKVRPTSEACFILMDQGGETSRRPHMQSLLQTHRYDIEQTGTDASSKIGGVEISHGSQGVAIRTMHYGANVPYLVWPWAYHEYHRLNNLFPKSGEDTSRLTNLTGVIYDIGDMVSRG